MSFFSIFDIAGSGMNAQSVRLNIVSSNLANAQSVAGSPAQAYRARHPVFTTILNEQFGNDAASVGVAVTDVIESQVAVEKRYAPDNPIADKDGYVYTSNVNTIEEMANMISASRSFQQNVEVIETAKQLFLRTLMLGQ
ncbi:MAG: flagellar basal-body rod protein FlgC [Gammaproteobacteria bacterium]|nr:MAG: flagellar basal-body rod protein FlgC [Gammaproteobacteria bacterium]TND06697.1 MAG: flagellar basal-body rod protein FlgC [Gammaproteobacteria bacterium]